MSQVKEDECSCLRTMADSSIGLADCVWLRSGHFPLRSSAPDLFGDLLATETTSDSAAIKVRVRC